MVRIAEFFDWNGYDNLTRCYLPVDIPYSLFPVIRHVD